MANTPCVLFMSCSYASLGIPVGDDLIIEAILDLLQIQVFATNGFPLGGYDFTQLLYLLENNIDVWITGGGGGQGWKIQANPLPTIGTNLNTGAQQLICNLIDVKQFSFNADSQYRNGIPVIYDAGAPIFYVSVQIGSNGYPIFTNTYGNFPDTAIMPQISMDFYNRFDYTSSNTSTGTGTGSGSGYISGPYIIKLISVDINAVSSVIEDARDPDGNSLMTNSNWSIVCDGIATVTVTFSNVLSNGQFTNFRKMAAINSNSPTIYSTGSISGAGSFSANVRYVPSESKLIFGNITGAQYGYTTSNLPVYILFDLNASPNFILF